MNTRCVLVGIVCAALPATACEPSNRALRNLPSDAPAHVRAAVEACGALDRPEKTECYEPLLLARLEREGVSSALEMLESLGAADVGVERDGHVYTHAIGIEAYRMNPDVAEVFAGCSSLFQSGCYHGVIQAHFMAEGEVDSAVVNELCEAYRGPDRDRFVLFQCLHGLGHGLTMFYRHDLPRALGACDYLEAAWDRKSCYGGAFMENIMTVTSPHHPATELAEGEGASESGASRGGEEPGDAGAAEAHDHPTEAHDAAAENDDPYVTASGWKALDPEDPLYPCSALDERYWRECYLMQTSAMLYLNQGDIAAAARGCDQAPERMRDTCYRSLGRDISSYTLQDHEESIRLCKEADEAYVGSCYVGLVKNFIDLTAETDDAFEFCREVEGDAEKKMCYEAIGEQIGILEAERERREALCRTVESPTYLQSCLRGARVSR